MQRVALTYNRMLGLALALGVAVAGMVLFTPDTAAASTLERTATAPPTGMTPGAPPEDFEDSLEESEESEDVSEDITEESEDTEGASEDITEESEETQPPEATTTPSEDLASGDPDAKELALLQEAANGLDPTGLSGFLGGVAPAPTNGQGQGSSPLGGLIG